MIREIKEEIGYTIKDYKYFRRYLFIPKSNTNLQLTYHMYIAKAPDLNILTIHKRGGIKAFTLKQALTLRITEKDKEILQDIIAMLHKGKLSY
jgi:8-oxo-dGTP pyrophosphatase MutT (NUDIX family)